MVYIAPYVYKEAAAGMWYDMVMESDSCMTGCLLSSHMTRIIVWESTAQHAFVEWRPHPSNKLGHALPKCTAPREATRFL